MAKAGDNYLTFMGPDAGEQGYQVTVPDSGTVWAFATDGTNLVRIVPETQQRVTDVDGKKQRNVMMARLNGTGVLSPTPINYWVSSKAGMLSVEGLSIRSITTQNALLAQASGSNYLFISHPVFMGTSLDDYADFKRSQGYTVSIIDYLQVVETFGGGQAGPEGLMNFLAQAKVQDDLDHVLIVGGSTYDHTGKLDTGALTFIPGHYGQSGYSNYTVSDVPYITDSDNNLMADIGRWPVRSMSDLQTIVDKTIQWSDTDHSSGTALLIAEHTVAGENIDFGAALDAQLAPQLPPTWSTTQVYVDQILSDNPGFNLHQALVHAKATIISELNTTPNLVLYNGHASTGQLSNQNLFKAEDISEVVSEGAEIWLPLSCYVTFYESTNVNTLAHQLLFSGNAVNISGATLLSSQAGNIAAGSAILESTLNQGMRLGEAINAHKASQGNPHLNINWALLGDPTSSF